ncbi:MAG TPA: CopG family transcriptional regulator [Deltaproteobacteria bacterium]|nr:CopG family transcriptional regulator [Deltaproteobacteria bacterium]
MRKKSLQKKFETAEEMDKALESADLSQAFRDKGVIREPRLRKINLDFPESVIEQIDQIARKIGVSRQPLLKIWIHERLKLES